MELNLDDARDHLRPPISKLVIHNQKGEPQFVLEYDIVDQEVKFRQLEKDPITDILVATKSKLTTDKGVEAFGSFVAGAEQDTPVYRHLLSIYLPQEDSTFIKFHVTVDDTLEHSNLQNSMLFAAECYVILYNIISEYMDSNTVAVENYPLMTDFFFRSYSYNPFQELMEGRDIDGSDLDEKGIRDAFQDLSDIIEKYNEYLEAADLSIMTISGAIVARKQLMNQSMLAPTLHMMTHSTINSPGTYCNDGQSITWFPFTKNKVGKINRAISTTLNTLSYASAKRDMQEQVQTNIAHKFHDLIDIVSDYKTNETQSLGLQTNVGQLVCSLRFKEEYHSEMSTLLEISQFISDKVKQCGQQILGRVAKLKEFNPISS